MPQRSSPRGSAAGPRSCCAIRHQLYFQLRSQSARGPRQGLQSKIAQFAGFDSGDHRLADTRTPRKRRLREPPALAQLRNLVLDHDLGQFLFDLLMQTEFIDFSFECRYALISAYASCPRLYRHASIPGSSWIRFGMPGAAACPAAELRINVERFISAVPFQTNRCALIPRRLAVARLARDDDETSPLRCLHRYLAVPEVMTEKRWRAVQVFNTELQKFDVWRRKTAPDAGVYTFRGQRWLSEGVDKVAERDAAGGKDSENSGTGVPACRCCASFLARATFESCHRTGHDNE